MEPNLYIENNTSKIIMMGYAPPDSLIHFDPKKLTMINFNATIKESRSLQDIVFGFINLHQSEPYRRKDRKYKEKRESADSTLKRLVETQFFLDSSLIIFWGIHTAEEFNTWAELSEKTKGYCFEVNINKPIVRTGRTYLVVNHPRSWTDTIKVRPRTITLLENTIAGLRINSNEPSLKSITTAINSEDNYVM